MEQRRAGEHQRFGTAQHIIQDPQPQRRPHPSNAALCEQYEQRHMCYIRLNDWLTFPDSPTTMSSFCATDQNLRLVQINIY